METARDVRGGDDLQQSSVVGELPRAEALAEVGVQVDGRHWGIVHHRLLAGYRRAVHRRRLVVKDSRIHGRGVFARVALSAGEELIDYQGEVITWQEASRRYEESDQEFGHTFFFDIDDDLVIDGGVNGNDSRWINHSCEPNCEFEQQGRRVVVKALRDIAPGEELLLDYRLQLDDEDDHDHYACRCGAPSCRRTMAAPS